MSRKPQASILARQQAKPVWARLIVVGVFVAILALVPVAPLSACPNCREALAWAGRAAGYAGGILMLLATPAGIALFWAFQIVRLRKKMN